MNNKIVSRKKSSAIFLAIVLVAGTITAISPTFMIGAQGESYYGMDNSYDDKKSYGMDDSYGYSDYQDDKDKKYDSYGPPVYGMNDNSYDDRKSYGNDNSYKPQYTSYGKDDKRDKSKDAIIKKIKCNNINLNANGGELNETSSFPFLSDIIGEKESNADERSVSSYGSYGGGNYGSGHSGSNKDFASICINNNNNTVVEEEPPVEECPEADDIESCFRQILLDFLFPNFVDALESEAGITIEINGQEVTLRSFEDICEALEGLTFAQLTIAIGDIIAGAEIELTAPSLSGLIQCIAEVLSIPIPID